MFATDLHLESQAIGLRTYLLDKLKEFSVPKVKFLTCLFCLNVVTKQPDHVTYGKLGRFFTLNGVLLLCSSDLLPVLLDCSLEFNKLVGLLLGIKQVWDGSVSWYDLNACHYAGVKPLLSRKQCAACRIMDAIIVGKLG